MTTARIAAAGDSLHAPPLLDETRYESTAPATTPIRVPKRRLRTKSKAGPESVTSPEATDPATARVKTVPTVSLKPDSATRVWATLGFSRISPKSGIRMAGSVAAKTAPTMRATGRGTPKTGATVTATITAVRKRPGRTRRPKPT